MEEEVKIPIRIDDSGFAAGMKRNIGQMEELSSTARKSGMSIGEMSQQVKQLGRDIADATSKGAAGFGRLEQAAVAFFSIQQAKAFVGKVYEVRSEIEKLGTSFRILVGDQAKADELFSQIRKFAVETPMQLKDLAGAAQTMMGFGIATEDVMANLEALGNVAMGDSQKFESLALAFSQMSATGKLTGQDLLQMINAGFNPLEQMSSKTGKSIAVLKEEMSEGAISAEMVRDAFMEATSEGGKFNGMLEAQSKTLAGAYSNLEGAIDDMLNEIGEKSEGIMSGAIEVATALAAHYETVGRVLSGLAGTYGVYKAAVMVVTAVEAFRTKNLALQAAGISGVTAAEAAHYGWLVLVEKAQKLLNATMLANPYVLVATLIAGVAAALWNMKSQQDLVNEAEDEYNRKKAETIAKEQEHASKLNELIGIAGNEALSTGTRSLAMTKLMQKYPELFEKYDTEIDALKDIAYWKAKIAEIESGKSITLAKNELEDINRQIQGIESALKKRETGRGGQYEDKYAGTSSTQLSARLRQLTRRREQLSKEQSKDAADRYMADLTGVSNEELGAEIRVRRELLSRMAVQEKEYGRVKSGGARGVFGKSEIAGQLKKLEWEENRRKEPEESAAEKRRAQRQEAAAKAAEQAAKRAAAEKRRAEQEREQEAAQDAARQERQFEQELSERERQWKQREELEEALSSAAIAGEQDRGKRELLEAAKAHKDALAAIERRGEEMRKANYEAAQKAWETKNRDKGTSWSETSMAKDVAANGYKNIALTAEQKATLKAQEAEASAVKVAAEKEREQELVESYQSYTDKKLAIEKKYETAVAQINVAIATASARGDAAQVEALKRSLGEVEKERVKSQSELSLEALKQDPEYIRAFEDLESVSRETLEHLSAQFEAAGRAASESLDPADLQVYASALSQMREELSSRDPFGALVASSERLKQARSELRREEQQLLRVERGEQIPTSMKLNKETGEIEMRYLSVSDAQQRVRQSTDKLRKEQKEHGRVVKKCSAGLDDLAASVSALGSSIGGEAGDILSLGANIVSFYTTAADSIDALSGMTAGALKTIEAASVILTILSTAWQIGQQIYSLFGESEEEKQARQAREEMMRQMTSSVESYRLAVIEARQAEESWFAGSRIGELASQWELSSAAQKSYFEVAREQTSRMKEDIGGWEIMGTIDANNGRYRFFESYMASLKEAHHAFDMEIENEQDQLETLSSFVKRVYGSELFDREGMLDGSAVSRVLEDYGDRIAHDDREVLETLKELSEQYGEWREELREYINEEYGELSDTLVESLWSWYDEGAEVMGTFRSTARETFRSVSSDLLKELVNSSVFGTLKEELTGAFEAYSKAVNSGVDTESALAALAKANEAALSSFMTTTEAALPTLEGLTQQLGEMSDRLFGKADESGDGDAGVEEYFSSIREAWVSTVTGMKDDSASLGKEISRILFEELVGVKVFDTKFDEWLRGWVSDYEAAAELSDVAAREQRMAELTKEREAKLAELTAATAAYAEATGYSADETEAFATSLDTLGETLLTSLLETEQEAGSMGAEIGKKLVEEMLKEMLKAEKYAQPQEEIRGLWQQVLKGGGRWTDAETGVSYTLDDVLGKIASLNDEMASDAEIQKATQAWQAYDKALKESTSSIGDLHDKFMDAIFDLDEGAAKLSKKLRETMARDLVEKRVFGATFTAEVTGLDGGTVERVFEDFEAYEKDWTERYVKALEAGDEAVTGALLKELEEREAAMAKSAEETVKAIEEATEDSTFSGLGEHFEESLMDMDATAADWGEEIGRTLASRLIAETVKPALIEPLLKRVQTAFDEALSGATTTGPEGERTVDWEGVLGNEGLKEAIADMEAQYPELKAVVEQIMTLAGVKPDLSNSLDTLGETLVERLTSAEEDVEAAGKQIGGVLIREMLKEMLKTGPYAEKIAAIKQQWQDILSGADTVHTWEDVVKEIEALEGELGSADGAFGELSAKARELGSAVEESTEAADESFSSLGDSLTSVLTDTGSTAADWGREIGRTLASKIVKELIVEKSLQTYLDDIQAAYDTAIAETGATTSSVLAAVRPKIDAAVDATERWKAVAEEVSEAFMETSTPIDDLRSSFLSGLMDMESDAKTFAADIGKILTEAFVDKFVLGDEFDRRLEAWQQEYASIMGGSYSESERVRLLNKLKEAIVTAKEGYAEEAAAIQELMGLGSEAEDQSAYMNTAEKMTYDQADLIGGMVTSLVMGQQEGNAIREQILSTLRGLDGATVGGGYGEEIYNRLRTMSDNLQVIRDDVHAYLGSISEKVSRTNQLLGG